MNTNRCQRKNGAEQCRLNETHAYTNVVTPCRFFGEPLTLPAEAGEEAMTAAGSKPEFYCPANMTEHLASVLRGEYDVPGYTPTDGATVLDLGANLGAFVVWLITKHPDLRLNVICFEPHPSNASYLRENISRFLGVGFKASVTIHEEAVYTRGDLTLYEGVHNCGENSLWHGEEQSCRTVTVHGRSPADLPACSFLKIDTEGAEMAILLGYPHMDGVKAVALEFHSSRDRQAIKALLNPAGFTLVGEDMPISPERGTQKWLRTGAKEAA